MDLDLSALGLDDCDQAVYRLLIDRVDLDAREAAKVLGEERARIDRSIRRLVALGLAVPSAERERAYTAKPPDVAIEAVVAERQRALDELRLAGRTLIGDYRRARAAGSHPIVERVEGPEALARHGLQIQMWARKEILVFLKPPFHYRAAGVDYERQTVEAPGRAIADPSALDQLSPEVLASYQQHDRTLRVFPVPFKAVVADTATALVEEEANGTAPAALVVHGTVLVQAVVALFEALWDRATPLPVAGLEDGGDLSAEDRELLLLLLRGLTESAIARQLGVAPRTVQRRIQVLVKKAGAQNRHDLILQAARRGWVSL